MKSQWNELSPAEIQRYKSQINLCEMGVSGQKKLKSAAVIVIGAGGLGCAALSYLAAAGVGKVGIVDDDHIEIGNLQRQVLYHQAEVGKLKCEVAKQRITQINPHIFVNSIATYLSNENAKSLIEDYDIVIDATDNFCTRYAINEACLQTSKPFVYGSIQRFEGQIAVFNASHTDGKRGPNYCSLYPIPPPAASLPSCFEGGVLAPLPGVVGAIQALEALKLILQIGQSLSGRLLKIDALTWTWRLFEIEQRDRHLDSPLEIRAEALYQLLLEKINVQLIDIREGLLPPIKGFESLSIPFSKLLDDHAQISKDKVTVLCCHHGISSLQAVTVLRERHHFRKLYSLKGGISTLLELSL